MEHHPDTPDQDPLRPDPSDSLAATDASAAPATGGWGHAAGFGPAAPSSSADQPPTWAPPGTQARSGPRPPDDWFDPPASQPTGSSPHRSVKSWVMGGIGAVAIAGAALFGVSAASSHSASTAASATAAGGQAGMQGGPGGGGMGTSGTITAISGSTITVKTTSGTTKVTTSSATKVSEATKATVGAVAVGDHVTVMGTTSGTKVTAAAIVDRGTATDTAAQGGPGGAGGTPPSGGPGGSSSSGASGSAPAGGPPGGMAGGMSGGGRPVDGTVTKVSGSTLTVKGRDGQTYTVTATSATTVTVEKASTVSALAVGEKVQVMGTTTNGTVAATRITEGAITTFGGQRPTA